MLHRLSFLDAARLRALIARAERPTRPFVVHVPAPLADRRPDESSARPVVVRLDRPKG